MNDKPYFVMLNCQKGGVAPLVNDDEELCMFECVDEALSAGKNNILGECYGFEVFEVGLGVADG